MSKPPLPNTSTGSNANGFSQSDSPENRIAKLETLLAEKSRNIQLLQKELQASLTQINEFDKVKTLLDEEITHLKDQNRIFRSELGIPAVPSSAEHKENSNL
jgi:hypothetical protein